MIGIRQDLLDIIRVAVKLKNPKLYNAIAFKNGEKYSIKLACGFVRVSNAYIPHFYLDVDKIVVELGSSQVELYPDIDKIYKIDKELLTEIVRSVDKIIVDISDSSKLYELFMIKKYLTTIAPFDADKIDKKFETINKIFAIARDIQEIKMEVPIVSDYTYIPHMNNITIYKIKDVYGNVFLYDNNRKLVVDDETILDNIDNLLGILTIWLNTTGDGRVYAKKDYNNSQEYVVIEVKEFDIKKLNELQTSYTIMTNGIESIINIENLIIKTMTPTIYNLISNSEYLFTTTYGDIYKVVGDNDIEIVISKDVSIDTFIRYIRSIKKVVISKTFVRGISHSFNKRVQKFTNNKVLVAIKKKLFS